jgi:GIY-YIG catalytic domain
VTPKRASKTVALSAVAFRRTAAREIPARIGVYALCDLDGVPIYVGKSEDGIRARVNRHITSARSDVIANRMLDVWEVASVRCWPVKRKADLKPLEDYLFHRFHKKSPLMNGAILPAVRSLGFPIPKETVVQLMPEEEVRSRQRVELRLPRQAKQFLDLLDHYLNVKESSELHLALKAHFERLHRYFKRLHLRSPSGSE